MKRIVVIIATALLLSTPTIAKSPEETIEEFEEKMQEVRQEQALRDLQQDWQHQDK